MKSILSKIDTILHPLRLIASHIAEPIFLLILRIYIGYFVFFKSGLIRFQSFLDGSWDTQIFLFSEEHPIPGIPGEVTAPLATFGELFLPILLISGLFGRAGAAGLIVMTIIIEWTYGDPDRLFAADHMSWIIALSILLIRGPGLLSVDHFLVGWIRGTCPCPITAFKTAKCCHKKTSCDSHDAGEKQDDKAS